MLCYHQRVPIYIYIFKLSVSVCICVCTGLESVDHYPILVAVTGILVRLLVDSERQGWVLDPLASLELQNTLNKAASSELQRLPLMLKSEQSCTKGLLMLSKQKSKCLVYWMAVFWQRNFPVSLLRSSFFLKTLVARGNWTKWHRCACVNVW